MPVGRPLLDAQQFNSKKEKHGLNNQRCVAEAWVWWCMEVQTQLERHAAHGL